MSDYTPNPGSAAARQNGCICPVIDNGHGNRNDGRFVMVIGCPIHMPEDWPCPTARALGVGDK